MHTCTCGERYHSEKGRIDCEKSHAHGWPVQAKGGWRGPRYGKFE